MKRFLVTMVLVALCVGVPLMFIQADPGTNGSSGSTATTDSTTVSTQYGPAPPGYQGIWPPPDYTTTSTDTTGGGESPPFDDPDS